MHPPGFHTRNISAGRPLRRRNVIQRKLGKRIQNLRKKSGLSQEQLAQRARMSSALKLGKIERGEVNISLSTMVHLAGAFKTTIARLFRGIP